MASTKLKEKNESFRTLKLRLKQSQKFSYIEIDNILSNVQDKKAFVFLMDSHETEKEITREILEGLLENIIELNSEYCEVIESILGNKKSNAHDMVTNLFQPKNLKSLIIAAVTIGLILAVAFSENVAIKVIDIITPKELTKEDAS